MTRENWRAALWGLFVTATLALLIVAGSRNLAHFDAALVGYTFATLFAAFGIAYRYAMWLQRPPTALYWRRGWQLFLRPRFLGRNLVSLARRFFAGFVLNLFILRRSRERWLAHWLIMWGCIAAAAITFPLVFGWIHFETDAADLGWYRTYVFGFPTFAFPIHSGFGFFVFHGLVWASILVIAGVMLAMRRRMRDYGAAALQQFGEDFLPLVLLFAVSVTGLMLTASYTWMKGHGYEFLALLHAVTVIFTLLWLPFGKFFHLFMRPAQLGVSFYKEVGRQTEQAHCRRCGEPFASRMHVEDLIEVERQLGYRYELSYADKGHYQWVCPRCRRAMLALAQGDLWADSHSSGAEGGVLSSSPLPQSRERGGRGAREYGKRLTSMATIPTDALKIIDHYGPHRNYMDGLRLQTAVEPDAITKTHCCFCGQQCGIQLKVKDNEVIGFEPWEDFPFNRGMLCPKGVKRYLQGAHPDRLTTALARDPAAPGGFRPLPYDAAIRHVADAIQRIQAQHGPDAFAVLSGASLTTEKTYLMGKFARVCLKSANIDYNGRLCMVSAAAGNKKAFGIDRGCSPWTDILKAKLIWVSGANVAECAPITTNYIWQARENGARVIVVDPRITPLARTCDLFLPVKPGRDVALFNGILHLMIEHNWLDHGFIRDHTVGFEEVAAHVREWTPARTAEVTGIAERLIRQAAEWWGTAESSFLMHARGLEHHTHGVQNVLGAINIVLASGRIGREGCGYATITGQGNGQGGREHGQKADQLPGARDLANPEHRAHVARVWGVDPESLPGPGVDCYEIFRKVERGEVRGLLSISFNPKVSLPDSDFVARMLDKLDFYVAIDFFLNETARHADVVLPGSLHEEDEGVVCSAEGRVIKINKALACPGDAKQDWRIIQDIAQALGRPHGFTFTEPRQIFDELRQASAGGVADYSGITYERLEAEHGIFWPCPAEGHPGTPRLFEPGSWNPVAKGAGPFYFPDGKARFNVAKYSPPAEDVDAEYPVILTTGRVVSHFLSGTQTRRIGPLVDQYPEPRVELHPRLAEKLGIADGDWTTVQSRRGTITLRAQVVTTIRPDTVFVPYHWAGAKSINRLTIAAQDPISKIPEYKVCAVKVSKAPGEPAYERELEPQQ